MPRRARSWRSFGRHVAPSLPPAASVASVRLLLPVLHSIIIFPRHPPPSLLPSFVMPTMAPPLRRTALVACAILAGGGCNAFTVPSSRKVVAPAASSTARCSSAGSGEGSVDRRSVLSSLLAASAAVGGAFLPSEARAEAETMERGGVPLTPFNSLAFNYRGEYEGGLGPRDEQLGALAETLAVVMLRTICHACYSSLIIPWLLLSDFRC